MYASIYIYRVPKRNVEAFLRVQREAKEIYKRYGVLDDVTLAAADLHPKYGCMGFENVLETAKDEEIFVGVSYFHDRAHHDKVMAKVDNDKRVNELYNEVTVLLDISRVVRGEFKFVV